MSDDFSSNTLSTGVLAAGAKTAATFDNPFDSDWFKITLTAGQTYLFSLDDMGSANALIFPYLSLSLYDKLGKLIDTERPAPHTSAPVLQFSPLVSGDYFIAAELFDGRLASASYVINAVVQGADDFPSDASTTGVLAPGGQVQGQFDVVGDRDWFSFTAEPGQHYVFSGASGAGLVPVYNVRVFDPASGAYATQSINTPFEPAIGGTYYVSAEGHVTGNYRLVSGTVADDYAGTEALSTLLQPGGHVDGKLDYLYDVDSFKMHLQAGTVYHLALSGTGTDLNYLGLTLLASDAEGMVMEEARTTNGVQLYTYVPAITKDYFFGVYGGWSWSGQVPYTLSATSNSSDEFANTDSQANLLAAGTLVNGALQYKTDVDVFKVVLEAGTTYLFEPGLTLGKVSHAVLSLHDAGGTTLCAGQYDAFSFTPYTSATYYLNWQDDVGNDPDFSPQTYTVRYDLAADDVGASPAKAGTLSLNSVTHGTLERGGGDRDWFAITLAAGITYDFSVDRERDLPGELAFGLLNSVQLQLFDANGQSLASTKGIDSDRIAAVLSYTATASATYYLQMSSPYGYTGNYVLQAAIGHADDYGSTMQLAAPIELGVTKHGLIEYAKDKDVFSVNVQAGQLLEWRLSGASDLHLTVFDPSGRSHDMTLTGGRASFAALETGHYFAIVGTTLSEVTNSAYDLQVVTTGVDDNPSDATTTSILAVDGQRALTSDYPGDIDWVKVHLEAGQSYVFGMHGSASASGTLDTMAWGTYFTLYGSNSSSIASTDYGKSVEPGLHFTASTTGDYFLGAHPTLDATGSYTLSATRTTGDTTPPVLVTSSPEGNAQGFKPTSNITLHFSEAIELAASQHGGISMSSNGSGQAFLNGNGDIKIAGNNIVIDPVMHLAPGTTYTIQVDAGSIKDLAGNAFGGASVSFTTAPAASQGSGGNDYLVGHGKGETIDGGSGIDTVYYDDLAQPEWVSVDADGHFKVQAIGAPAGDTLIGIERILFPMHALALDIDGHGGQAYRLYQAAFHRTPDQAGVGYWMDALDGGTGLRDVANFFVHSAEFGQLYGTDTSDAAFVALLYNNVLKRSPDQAGSDYWVDAFHNGLSRADALLFFSESKENEAALIGDIGKGFPYIPFH